MGCLLPFDQQVIFRRSRARMMELMRTAENKYRQVLEEHVEAVNSQWSSGSGSDKVSDAKVVRPPSREICKQKVFEDELKHALGPLKTGEATPKKSYPIASAVGECILPFHMPNILLLFSLLDRASNFCCAGPSCKGECTSFMN